MKYCCVALIAVMALLVSCGSTNVSPDAVNTHERAYVNPALDNIEPDEKVVIDRFSSKVSYYSPADGRMRTSDDDSQYFAYPDLNVPHKYFSYGDSQGLDYKLFELKNGRPELIAKTPGTLMLPIGKHEQRELFVSQEFDDQKLPAESAIYELTSDNQLILVSELPFVVMSGAIKGNELYVTRYADQTDDFDLYSAPISRPEELSLLSTGHNPSDIRFIGESLVVGAGLDDRYPDNMCELSCDSLGENLIVWLAVEDDELSVKSTHAESGTTRSITSGPILGFEVNGQTLEVYTSNGVENYPLGEIND